MVPLIDRILFPAAGRVPASCSRGRELHSQSDFDVAQRLKTLLKPKERKR